MLRFGNVVKRIVNRAEHFRHVQPFHTNWNVSYLQLYELQYLNTADMLNSNATFYTCNVVGGS